MSNLTENRLNTILSDEQITSITTAITGIVAALPAGSLTDEQRSSLKAIDVSNKIFVEDTLNELQNGNADIIPAYIKAEYIRNDKQLFEQLDSIEISLQNTLQLIADLKRIAGDEAYSMSLAVYKIYAAANAAGIPGAKQAYDRLKARFEAQGSTGRPASEDPVV